MANEQVYGDSYRMLLEAALKSPYIIGTRWLQYLDQPASGRLLDGESGRISLVGVTSLSFAGFTDAVRRSSPVALSRLPAMASSTSATEPPLTRKNSAGS